MSRCRFSVCARNADQMQPMGRLPVKRIGEHCHRPPAIADDNHRHIDIERAFGNDCYSPVFYCLFRKIVPIDGKPFDANKQCPFFTCRESISMEVIVGFSPTYGVKSCKYESSVCSFTFIHPFASIVLVENKTTKSGKRGEI